MGVLDTAVNIGSLGTVGSVGELTGSTAATEAATEGIRAGAEAGLASTRENIEFQKWLWGEQKALQQPYARVGKQAIGAYKEALATPLTMDELYQEPGYQFGLTEGQRAMETSGAARGMQLSGAQAKGLTRFGTDYASTKYNQAFQRRQMNLDNLYRMISTGQAAASGQAAAGSQMGSAVGQSILEGGRIQGQMYSDIGNIQAAGAMAPFNTLMDVGNLGASLYRGGA
jgi:hypothetical protein